VPYSLKFGRSGDSYGNRTTNNPATSAMTWMGWIYPTSVAASDKVFFSIGNLGAFTDYEFMVSTAALGLWNGSTVATGSTLVVNVWRHVALTVNGTSGSNALAYLDGVLNITQTAAATGTGNLRIGSNGGAEPFIGSIGCVKIWNRALTVDEINAERLYATPINFGALNAAYVMPTAWDAANYDLDALGMPATAASRWYDLSGVGGNDMTETGTIDYDVGPPVQFAPSLYRRTTRRFVAAAVAPPSRRRIHLVT
jgi:hypothetical protein